ncbi:hypothetical protein HanPSC8_Chr15g0683961 [Helianthus annuus]|nr:hypothetical protein HanPSC8_Chr15g0683961 [Helianthus annuus]
MLSEMFNFSTGGVSTGSVQNQMNYQKEDLNVDAGDWYGNTAQAMQLFVMNPSQESPSSQSSSHHHHNILSSSSSTHHMSSQFPWVPPGGGQSHGLSLSYLYFATLGSS